MSSWGTRRRNLILTIFFSGIFVIVAVNVARFLQTEATCFDGIQNQGELGIDCGGPCDLMCSQQIAPPVVKWTRFFQVAGGAYNAVAYIENQNPDAKSDPIRYKFTLRDDRGAVLADRIGTIEMRPSEVIPVFAESMNTGAMSPARMDFEILNLNEVDWYKATQRTPYIVVTHEELSYPNLTPNISARIENTGFRTLKDIYIVVIVYNEEDNAIGVSRTYVDEILSNQRKNILFTWPQDFSDPVSRFEIIPLYETD